MQTSGHEQRRTLDVLNWVHVVLDHSLCHLGRRRHVASTAPNVAKFVIAQYPCRCGNPATKVEGFLECKGPSITSAVVDWKK